MKQQMNGSGHVQAGAITMDLHAELSGSGDLEANELRANTVNALMHRYGSVSLGGFSKLFRAEITGSGDLEACGLSVENASAMLRSSTHSNSAARSVSWTESSKSVSRASTYMRSTLSVAGREGGRALNFKTPPTPAAEPPT